MGSQRTRTVDTMDRKRREGWLQRFPFCTTRLAAFTHLLSNVMRFKCFLSHLNLTLSWYLNTKLDHDAKGLPRHTIPSFVSSKSPLWLLLGSWETPQASHSETEVKRCLRRNQRRAARAAWVRCVPSTSRRDSIMGELARSSRRCAQPFLPNHCSSERNRACLPGLLWSSSREGATRSVQATRWARTRNCSRSSILAPSSSGSGSPPLSSRAAHEEGPKRNPPLVPVIALSEAVKGHWTQEGYIHGQSVSPIGLRRSSAFGSDWWRGKVRLAFRLHTASPDQDQPKYASLSALQIRHTPTLVARTLDADLSTDHRSSATPEQSGEGSLKRQPTCLRQRKYSQSVKDQGEDVHGARLRSAL